MDYSRMGGGHGNYPPGAMHGDMLQHQQHGMMGDGFAQQQQHMGHMYGDGGGTDFSQHASVLMDGGGHFGVSTLTFDTRQELVWVGNTGGHVTSYYGIDMQKYTSFQVHATNDIRQILPLDSGILFLTKNSLRLSIRRGLSILNYQGQESMQDMQCMMMTGPSAVLMGGHQAKAVEFDLTKGQEMNQFDIGEPGCAIFRQSARFICAGDTSGKVKLYDPNTMKAEHVLDAHSGTLSDFDVHEHLLVTCGFSNRMGNLTADRFLMVYDMRVMRAVAPMQVHVDPMFIRFVPDYSNKLAIVSQTGHFQLVEAIAMPPPMVFYQVNTNGTAITGFDMSPSCQSMMFGDNHGMLHEFTLGDNCCFNMYPEPTEFPDPVQPLPPIHIDDEMTPYSVIPMIYPTNGHLMSDWPVGMCKREYRKPKPIDPQLLQSMKVYQNVGYVPNPGKGLRNQIAYRLPKEGQPSQTRKPSVPESPLGRGEDPFQSIPKKYQKVEMKYSKLGLEDFDFRHYNKTNFAGLETNIPNAYCNAALQSLYFLEPLRCHLLNHLCQREFCLSCELGFLFHMLDSQKGQTCQATNFLRAFRTIPEASALGLCLGEAEELAGKVNLSRLIQSWQRFVHQQVHSETCVKIEPEVKDKPMEAVTEASGEKKNEPATNKTKKKKKKGKKKESDAKDEQEQTESTEEDNSKSVEDDQAQPVRKEEKSMVTKLFAIRTNVVLRCRCGLESNRDNDMTLVNLTYPDCYPQGSLQPPAAFKFSQVIEHSLCSENTIKAWCNQCARYEQHIQKKVLNNLPDVLGFNCQLENETNLKFWKTQQEILKLMTEETVHISAVAQRRLAAKSCRYGSSCKRKDCKFRHDPEHDSVLDELAEQQEDDETSPKWLPLGLKIKLLPNGTVDITEISDEEPLPKQDEENTVYYELYGTLAHIKDKGAGNLVSHLNVGEEFHQRKERVTCTQWYLFNDFSITPIEKYEAVHFNLEWKVPCAVYYMRRYLTKSYDLTVKNPINPDIIYNDWGLLNPKRRKITYQPLSLDELPQKGDIVGLDAEFVSLKQEESELRSDGTRSTIKPSHMAAARITCLRGQGDKAGDPFIDDHISNQEQVVDYLTQYSGIKPGDLDPNVSTKHLTTLKCTYQKLRYMVDIGICFVGHGLKKDFRVINILVPKAQVIDTVELFHLPRQRMISLRFLAWYFLKINIQSDTHDSVEDARTALQLYKLYKDLKDEGGDKLQATIKEMYEFGRKCQWKIPNVEEEDMIDEQISFL
ncbi:PAN2-PAN3 deadenylation complex catalytic subunit Pan2-like isoform X2 [Gigantopelta aegis]|uniref:PAN2-PAN3 deadenylation complex catalytic subunit Pan2-like isoform X2 n=1 Tax=Gigantopelta aegis TaxID=1735272 RepID=UPI001B88B6E2|nr:PAN2-PAN3 deadenylation complex catalytic subunit Pan2-like isoform X2 [Gigantopelta aegis]